MYSTTQVELEQTLSCGIALTAPANAMPANLTPPPWTKSSHAANKGSDGSSTVKIQVDRATAVLALFAGMDSDDENDDSYEMPHDPVQTTMQQLGKAWAASEFEKRYGEGHDASSSRSTRKSSSPGPRYMLDGRGRLM